MRKIKPQGERGGSPTQNMNTQLRLKKTKTLSLIGLKVKKSVLKRMRSRANTEQRKKISLKVAVKAETRVKGQEAEIGVPSRKVMIEEVVPEVKKEMLIRKKRSRIQITVKIEIRVMNLIKNLKKTQKEKMVRELGQSH